MSVVDDKPANAQGSSPPTAKRCRTDNPHFIIRRAVATDVDAAAHVAYVAFRKAADAAGSFSGIGEEPTRTKAIVKGLLASQDMFLACCPSSGDILGLIAIVKDNAPAMYGVGPLAVSPEHQVSGIGRALMTRALEDIDSRGPSSSVRLTVDSFNVTAFPLYSKLGYEVKEPLTLIQYTSLGEKVANDKVCDLGFCVRAMSREDLDTCAALALRIARCDRRREIEAIVAGTGGLFAAGNTASIVLRGDDVVGYTTGFNMGGHTVCDSLPACIALISKAQGDFAVQSRPSPLRILMPCMRQPELLRWCLECGWKVLKQMILMGRGPYESPIPTGIFLPTADG